jgi:hypothetical protein
MTLFDEAAKKKLAREAERFVSALHSHARDVVTFADYVEQSNGGDISTLNREITRRFNEFINFSHLISERLRENHTERAIELNEQFDKLYTLVMRSFLQMSIRFCFLISAKSHLPIGSRELVQSELVLMSKAKLALQNRKVPLQMMDEIMSLVDLAEEILNEVRPRAPSLVEFDIEDYKAQFIVGGNRDEQNPDEANGPRLEEEREQAR